MTMRLDIMTNDAGELVRREHARELGAGVVVAIYRLTKLAQMHDLGNQAFVRQLEQTHQIIGEYCLRAGSNVSVLFADKATFVAGQLLKGNRGAYEAAAELGDLLERLGGSELHVARDITREDLNAFAEQISLYHRTGNASQIRLPPKMRLRRVADAARLRGIELEDLTPDQRIVRAYASAVVIMRRFFEDLSASRYVLPRRIKRIAQSLVDLSDASTASFLGVTEVRNANYDEAGRAVNTAILAVSIARETIQERTILAQIALAAMMHDVARPRALALAGAGAGEPPMPGMAGPSTLSEDQEDRLAAGAAAVLTALGRVNEPSITRTVLTFEALWLRRKTWLGPVYWGARPPTFHASILAMARRYNDLLTPEPGLPPPTTDFAVATLANELTDVQDRTVLRMLVSALGLLPLGTTVQLSTGEVAEVTRGTKGLGERPRVAVLADVNGRRRSEPVELDLAQDPRRAVLRVVGIAGWRKGLEAGPQPFGDDPYWAWGDVSEDPPASAPISSLGSSPSAVAGAMGRMINDSFSPPSISLRDIDRPDRTVVQPQGFDDVPPPRLRSTPPREPTARGNLASTPLPHVLVYMLDHALTGSVIFEETKRAGRVDDTIYFVNGVPVKVRLSESVALLGEVLVESGALEARSLEQAVESARRLGVLLGEYLVGHDLVSREMLVWALEGQLLRRIAHVANLAPEIQYAYYRDVDLLEGWGGEVGVSHPLNPILAGVRHWTDRARVRATLNRIGDHPLALHSDSDLSNLALLPEEQAVLDVVRAESKALPQLFEQRLADEEVVSSLVYSLAVTRQFAFKGQKKGPMAARGAAWRGVASGVRPAASIPVAALVSAARSAQAGTPPPPEARRGPPSRAPDAIVPSPSRAPDAIVPSPSQAPAASPSRAPSPAAWPAGAKKARPAPPQIRPIAAKKASTLRPNAGAPPELRGPPASSRQPASRLSSPPPEAVAVPVSRVSSPPPDAKTIARPAPSFEVRMGARALVAGANASEAAAPAPAADDDISDDVTGKRMPVDVDAVDASGGDAAIEEAIRAMSKLLIEDPSNEGALFHRAKLLVRTNRLVEAWSDFNELLSVNPHHREAQDEVRLLKEKLPEM